jgi:hypothetical protein
MRTFKSQTVWVALLLIALLGACKGESPTAPPSGGGPGGGGVTPPQNVSISLAASNSNPLVNSSSVVSATVTQGGQPVPNGTAVQFSSTAGLLDGAAASIIKTTTNGVATVTLSSTAPGDVTVTATVANVSQNVKVTFREQPVDPQPPSTAPTITSVSPTIGKPSGGQTLRITGTNFKTPVRVLFDTGGAFPIEAFVANVTPTTIDVVTPPIDLGAGQQLVADIIVITQAGSANEVSLTRTDAFTYQREQLTPIVSAISPSSGPVTGGTRVTIFGEGFQSPVQVMFGTQEVPAWQEAQVVEVQYGQIIVITPDARSTSPNGSATVTGPSDLRIINIHSNTEVVMDNIYRYVSALQITAAAPTQGTIQGGTNLVIDGIGFVAPVAVTVAGIPAQPLEVTGTRLVVRTSAPILTACENITGPIIVTNVVNGDSATGPPFTYLLPPPAIVGISPTVVDEGDSLTITVANAIPGTNRIKLGDRSVFISSQTIAANGVGTFVVTVPTNFEFETDTCDVNGVSGEQLVPLNLDVTYTNVGSTCTDTVEEAITILPASTACVLPPQEVTQVAPAAGSCADAGSVAVALGTGSASITFRNDGGGTLIVNAGAVTGTDAGDFSISPASHSMGPGETDTFTVTFDPSAAGARTATANFTTNDADDGEAVISVCLQGNGT